LPVNRGVPRGTYTKEDEWAGPVDKDYGEFYKKMSLNKKKVPVESVLFHGLFSIYRKLLYSTTIVFFEDSFRLQAYTQIACSGVMTLYVANYWPFARYVDNVSKIFNELCFVAILMILAYIKEIKSMDDTKTTSSPIGGVMIGITVSNMIFHGFRMTQNSIQAG